MDKNKCPFLKSALRDLKKQTSSLLGGLGGILLYNILKGLKGV
jgi:hypothetical protein